MSMLATRLQQGINELSLDISNETQLKLIQYIELIAKWNRTFNLTAIRDINEMLTLHLLDSLSVVPYIKDNRVLDVGAGAGLPGIVLALCYPDKEFVLLDSNGKKTRFMTQAKIELGLANVEVVQARIDEYFNDEKGPLKPFDAIISRAFASISDMLAKVDHLVTEKTTILAMKADSDNEISQMPESYTIQAIHELQVPGLEAKRQLIAISKLVTIKEAAE